MRVHNAPFVHPEGEYIYTKGPAFVFLEVLSDERAEALLGGALFNKSYAPTLGDPRFVVYYHDFEYQLFLRR